MNIILYMYIICIIYAYMTIYNIDLYIIIYIIYINMTCGKVLISVQFHLELSFHLFPHNKPQSCDFSINFYCVARTKARKTKETLSLKVKCYTSVSQNHPQENHSLWLFCVKMLKGVVSPLSFPDFLLSLLPWLLFLSFFSHSLLLSVLFKPSTSQTTKGRSFWTPRWVSSYIKAELGRGLWFRKLLPGSAAVGFCNYPRLLRNSAREMAGLR